MILFLLHQTLLLSPVTFTTGCCLHFDSASSFFLELFLPSSPVAFWAPTDLGSSSFSVISSCLFIVFMGFSRQEYWSGLPFPSQWAMFCQNSPPCPLPSWVALHGIAHGFIELDKAVVHVISLISFLWLWFSFCLPSDVDKYEAYGSFLIGGIDCGVNWVLFWWVGPCSVNL